MTDFNFLSKNISFIKGIGNELVKKFNKVGIYKVIDLLLYLPREVEYHKYYPNVAKAPKKQTVKITVTILKYNLPTEYYSKFKKTRKTLQVFALDELNQKVIINFFNYFNSRYVMNLLPIGSKKILTGKLEGFQGGVTINHPSIANHSDNNMQTSKERIYKTIEGISSKRISDFIQQGLKDLPEIPEWFDTDFIKVEKLPSFKQALINAHMGDNFNINETDLNLKRLSLDEVLSYQIQLLKLRSKHLSSGRAFQPSDISASINRDLLKILGFKLSNGQVTTIKEIYKDMSSGAQMIRLLQGDVGSGKTLVAIFSAILAISNGCQVVIMSPTEALAKQHLDTFLKYNHILNFNITFLTGAIKGKKRSEAIHNIISGASNLLIGTHALFQEDVHFKNLGLVIIDEQHRFGVLQRLELVNKASNPPHLLLLSATPIPRTMALTYYGDIAISELREKPKKRQDITTSAVANSKISSVLSRVKIAIERGEKLFWICPLIEESEFLAFTPVIERYNTLIELIDSSNAWLLHGKMKSKDKMKVLNDFRAAKKGILVSTTVIEVGIDIPDANIMIIEDAHQFGLAQLHQLRGRVGRGDSPGFCLLIYDDGMTFTAKKRMKIMETTSDGFHIAEEDYRIRGSGSILGTQQSGFAFFKVAKLEFINSYIKPLKTYAKMLIANSENNEKINLLIKIFDHMSSVYEENKDQSSINSIFYGG